jgi:hypothetical protein
MATRCGQELRKAAMKHLTFCLALWLQGVIAPCELAAEALRIDISPALDRRDHLSPRLVNWSIANGRLASTQFGNVQLEIRPLDEHAELKADWWKAGLVHDATMTSDGVFVDGDAGGLSITLRGLAPGRHSVVTYHNSIWDEALPPVDIVVNGERQVASVEPSRRVTDEADAANAYVEFDATDGQDMVLKIRPHDAASAGRVILNGLELNTANPAKKSLRPTPIMDDEHVAEKPTLTWQAAKSASAHDVYLGTDAEAVATATPSSPEYRGRQTETKFATDADDHFATYYWRVDEVQPAADGDADEITKGDVWTFRVRHLAFPGAEGYGRFARGGRGGRVMIVTNLNDSGPGSLREAVEAEGPRTVVFDVGGLITLESKLIIRNPYLTIAGQTAPGKGICIRKYNLGVGWSHDVIIRYIRVRPGNIAGVTLDGMGMAGTDHSIIDHCSISWTQDESFSSRGAKNITFQRNLISEALNIAGHKKYEAGKQHGYAASIGGDIGSFHHNLLAHCAGRNWSLAGGLDKAGRHTGRLDIRNNVVYNWGHRTTDGGVMQLNFVNNYYKPGPASDVFHILMAERHLVPAFGPQEYYVAGNVMEGHYGPGKPLAGVRGQRNEPIKDFIVRRPFFDSHVKTQSAKKAYNDVLADVGCNVPMLDEHDQRVIEETRSGTAAYKGSVSGLLGLPDTQDDVGGWEDYPEVHRPADWDSDRDGLPDAWEIAHGLNPNSPPGDFSDANADRNGDGYTNVEEYLNSLVSTATSVE